MKELRQTEINVVGAAPDFEAHEHRGRIEILPHGDLCLVGGSFDLRRAFDAWIGKLNGALKAGCDGTRFESAPGQGTVFHFTIPKKQGAGGGSYEAA